jgi:molybdopterin synthase sulfur carrier subunit
MNVFIRAFAGFREILGESIFMDLPEGSTLTGLLAELGTRSRETRDALFDDQGILKRHVIIMVNKKRQNRADIESLVLNEGDEVAIYPPVAGG